MSGWGLRSSGLVWGCAFSILRGFPALSVVLQQYPLVHMHGDCSWGWPCELGSLLLSHSLLTGHLWPPTLLGACQGTVRRGPASSVSWLNFSERVPAAPGSAQGCDEACRWS